MAAHQSSPMRSRADSYPSFVVHRSPDPTCTTAYRSPQAPHRRACGSFTAFDAR